MTEVKDSLDTCFFYWLLDFSELGCKDKMIFVKIARSVSKKH